MSNIIPYEESLMNIKNRKVVLYLKKVVLYLNYNCDNIIPREKYERAIAMFTNKEEDFEEIKQIIDWYAQNEINRYQETIRRRQLFARLAQKRGKAKKKEETLVKKKAA